MKAINKYIVIDQVTEEIKTESGILLSGDDKEKFRYSKGTIISPGTEVHSVKAGDDIYFDKGQGFTMIIDNKKYTIIQERDVVVVL